MIVPDVPISKVLEDYRFSQVINLRRELGKTIDYVDFYILSIALNNADRWEERSARFRWCG